MEEGEEVVYIPISDVFDLHAFAPRDVVAATEAYLEEAHRLGFVALRIIHGRGIGYQREKVREILTKSPSVLAFGDAPPESGGWGATVVTLTPYDANPSGEVMKRYDPATDSPGAPGSFTGWPSGE